MRFTWDENKNRANKAKHKVSFETARLAFDDPLQLTIPDRNEVGEERWKTFGQVGPVLIIVVVHTSVEEHGDEVIRIISARKATPHERALYEQGH